MNVSAKNGDVAMTSVASTAKAGIQGILDLVNNGDDTIKQLLSTVTSAANTVLTKIDAAMNKVETLPPKENRDEMITRFKEAAEYMEESLWGRLGTTSVGFGREWRNFKGEIEIKNEEGKWVNTSTYLAEIENGKRTFVTGGLADFTGPAWLDGTKSAPELVLNATDTTNFIELKDILSEILRGSHERAADAEGARSNNYYDIKVEVDSIDSDYGVDQAADRVRELIEEDAMYRNVTAVNKTR